MPADTLLVACNFSDEAKNLLTGCPSSGNWRVILNSADVRYGGEENDEIDELYVAGPNECNGFPLSLRLNLPAYSVLVLTPESA
jgi:1,4-alpha-glucan branching enzyme